MKVLDQKGMRVVIVCALTMGLYACGYMQYSGIRGAQMQPIGYTEVNNKIVLES